MSIMTRIATLGPAGSDSAAAARIYRPEAEVVLYGHSSEAMNSFVQKEADLAIIPVYNTREGEGKHYFRLMDALTTGYWHDNVVVPINLSIGALDDNVDLRGVTKVIARTTVLRQCDDFLATTLPQATLVATPSIETAIDETRRGRHARHLIIDSEPLLKSHGLKIVQRDIAPHNRTRFAVLAHTPHQHTGYDATSIITVPLADRVGLLVDTLNEFTKRGISIINLHSENDVKTQKLQIYLEAEGHRDHPLMAEALTNIENKVIQQPGCLKILGSFPRVDMRAKHIKSFGFIGTGQMSQWFAEQLRSDGYETIITGRSSAIAPEDMIGTVDVVAICVPISATTETINRYAPLLRDGQALIILAGEARAPLAAALERCTDGVEVMLVHNLWGPQAATMKDKNVAVVRTPRSGRLCNEFESFLYKFGAEIHNDSADQHDLLMGMCQKLPTSLSVALAMCLPQLGIEAEELDRHSTLTSLYSVLSMARVHNQRARTYAEIMAAGGAGQKVVDQFIENLTQIAELAGEKRIDELTDLIDRNTTTIGDKFLRKKMQQARSIDTALSDIGYKDD
jgi:chorismate mutase/prephenate dehydratase